MHYKLVKRFITLPTNFIKEDLVDIYRANTNCSQRTISRIFKLNPAKISTRYLPAQIVTIETLGQGVKYVQS